MHSTRRLSPVLAVSTLVLTAYLAGCSTASLEGPTIEYKSAGRASPLDIPPDLTQLPRDDRFNAPGVRGDAGIVRGIQSAGSSVLPSPSPTGGARLERAGTQRWIVSDLPAEKLWPIVKDFWTQLGFTLRVENPETGTLETDWAQDRSKLPKDFLGRTLGAIAGSLFDTGDRDMFRTRIEKVGTGTEIYISHRGISEVLNSTKDGTIWQPRPNDPNLEAEFLQRLLMRLGVDEDRAKASFRSGATPAAVRARVVGSGVSAYVEVDDDLERAWRRVGLALDRSGFTVEERNRGAGFYVVRYVQPSKTESPGFFSRIFTKNAAPVGPERYRVAIKTSVDKSHVSVSRQESDVDAKNSASNTEVILKLLADELK